MADDDALTAAIAEVLAAHRLIWGVRNGWSCLCGFIGGSGDSGLRGCEDHRAERVAHLVREHTAEVERLRRWKEEALPVMNGLQELGQALGLPLGASITSRSAVDAALDLRNAADAGREHIAAKQAEALREAAHWFGVVWGSGITTEQNVARTLSYWADHGIGGRPLGTERLHPEEENRE